MINFNVLKNYDDKTFYNYLVKLADKQFLSRKQEINEIIEESNTENKLKERQNQLKQNYLKIIGDLPGKRTPLNASTRGVIKCNDYHIEKIVYESRPNFYVTANLYLPARDTGNYTYPGVIVPCGHSMEGKAAEPYQKVGILLAKNGIVAMVVDPIGQGERFQFLDDSGKRIKSRDDIKHCLIDTNSLLIGRTVVGYEAWDNIRGIDYLITRPEVDASRIGCTGNSGGGTQTTFLMALDDRIKVAAPSCYIMTMRKKFYSIGPADCCQHLPFEGKYGFEIADYITMFAPKPIIILAAEKDIFDINSTSAVYREAKRLYKEFGFPDRIDLFASTKDHGFHKSQREMMVWWMRRWLLNENSAVKESELNLQNEEDLMVTDTGHVVSNWGKAVTTADLNLKRAKELAEDREKFWKEHSQDECLEKIKKLIGLRKFSKEPVCEKTGIIKCDGYKIEKLIIKHELGIPVPGLLYIPEKTAEKLPITFYVDGRGKSTEGEPDGDIISMVKAGRMVFTIDVRGVGETSIPNENRWENQRKTAILSFHIGHSLIGQRVEDVIAALKVIIGKRNIKENDIDLVGIGQCGPAALHAAVFESRFNKVIIKNSIKSFIDILKEPLSEYQFPEVVPFALKYYDLPKLMELIHPRKVEVIK